MLRPHDPDPVNVLNPDGKAPCLVVCDHASNRFPEALGGLCVAEPHRREHIAWDIGAAQIARRLSEIFDAPAVFAGYSRLVVDCNRYIDDPAAFVHWTDGIEIAANIRMTDQERQERTVAIYRPYHRAVAAILDRFDAAGISPAFLSIHTMTDRMRRGGRREQELALCWARDPRFALPVLERLRRAGAKAFENAPYRLEPGIDYTVPEHAMRRGLVHLQIEVRQDLVADESGAYRWAELIHRATSDLIADSSFRTPAHYWP